MLFDAEEVIASAAVAANVSGTEVMERAGEAVENKQRPPHQ